MTTEEQTELTIQGGAHPTPPPPTPQFVELMELEADNYARWSTGVMRSYSAPKQRFVAVWSESGDLDREEPLEMWRATLAEIQAKPDTTVEDELGEWRLVGAAVELLLPCGDTVYFSLSRLLALDRAFERMTPCEYGATIPPLWERE